MPAATKYVQTVLSQDVHKELSVFCMDNDISLHDQLRNIIEEWVTNNLNKEVINHGQEENGKEH